MAIAHRRTVGRLSLAIAAAAILFAAATAGQARVQGCPSDADRHGNKIVIGSVAELVGSVSTRNARALLASFEMRFERAGAELDSEAAIIYCGERRMRGSNAFSEGVVGGLNNDQVLLEVAAQQDGDDIMITYIVIPIRHYQYYVQGNRAAPGFHQVPYEQSRISAGLQQLFKDNAELRLMAALALALRYEKLADAETASDRQRALIHRSRAFYCDAVGSAESARPGEDFFGLPEADWRALLDFAQAGARRLFEKATGNPDVASSLSVVASERAGSSATEGDCILQAAALTQAEPR